MQFAAKLQTDHRPITRKFGICCGDSHTGQRTLGIGEGPSIVGPDPGVYRPGYWPAEMMFALRHDNWPPANDDEYKAILAQPIVAPIKTRCYGQGGDTSPGLYSRRAQLLQFGRPYFAFIYIGANDSAKDTTVSGAGSTTTVINVAAGTAAALAVAGSYILVGGVAGAGGVSRKVLSVVGDVITLTTPLASAPGNGVTLSIDTTSNIVLLATYLWTAGVRRIGIVGMHYTNFSSGGDTTTVQRAINLALRTLQQAAVAPINALGSGVNCIYVDTYAWMASYITNGTPYLGRVFTQGDFGWQIADSNSHKNEFGQGILGLGVASAVRNNGLWWPEFTAY